MKEFHGKSFFIVLIILVFKLDILAQGIVVNKTDGTKSYFKASEVQSVGVYGYGEGPDDTNVEHEWVDLGLPSGTLWAKENIGYVSDYDPGDFFAWGETVGYKGGKTRFNDSPYKYGYVKFTKYCTTAEYGIVDNKTELEAEDDPATANWGYGWQTPSEEQVKELLNSEYTTCEIGSLYSIDDVYICHMLTIRSKYNGKSLEFKGHGFFTADSPYDTYNGYYLTRNLDTNNNSRCRILTFTTKCSVSSLERYRGALIRPVRVNKIGKD